MSLTTTTPLRRALSPSAHPDDVREIWQDVLADPVDEVAVQRIWHQISARRQPMAPVVRRRVMTGFVTLSVAALVLAIGLFRAHRMASEGGGILTTIDGSDLGVLTGDATGGGFRTVDLSDGSRITVTTGARLETLENTGRSFVALLSRGHARFEVRPGGPRRWSIEFGLGTVEVVGTAFAVDRLPSRARIEVEHGVVLVRGERVPDRVARLIAGQSIEISGATASIPGALPENPLPTLEPILDKPVVPRAALPDWRGPARQGDYAEAYRRLGHAGMARAAVAAPVADLLLLADVARVSGHPTDGLLPLRRVLARHARDPDAPLAAVTLGRLELDTLGHPAQAAQAFARAIALGAPQGLMEDVFVRLIEARSRAGDRAGARSAYAEYLRRFPAGKRAAAARSWGLRE